VLTDLALMLPKGESARVKAKVISAKRVIAPVAAGQELGTIQFSLDGKVIDERKLVAAKAVPLAGVFGRAIDIIKLLFN